MAPSSIHLSPAAAAEIVRLRQRHANPQALFRLKIQPGGCAGFQYLTEFDETLQPDDRVVECETLRIVIDAQSTNYFDQLTLDFSEDLMGGSFRFHNPNAGRSCDCGVSFSLK